MIDDHSVLAIIPARGGSKGVFRKNIRKLAEKPLIAWTIEEAKRSKYIDRLILSSDDEEIMRIAKQWGCEVPFKRPVHLAQDDTPGINPVLHALETLSEQYEYVVLLQPTSPLRIADDIDKCIEACVQNQASTCVSVSWASQHPFWMYEICDTGMIKPFIRRNEVINRRQDLSRVYILNGAVYVSRVDLLILDKSFISSSTIAYIMPRVRSFDIDEEIDFKLCECILDMQRMKQNE